MPGYVIHLTTANMMLQILEKNDLFSHIDSEWKQKFYIGCLMPDAYDKQIKQRSHFWNVKDMNNIIIRPDIERFIKAYPLSLENPLLAGYFSHLYLDNVFWNYFQEKCVTFYDVNGKETHQKERIISAYVHKSKNLVLAEQVFTEDYLYGDYSKTNKYFMRKYNLEIPENASSVLSPVKEVGKANMKVLLKNLKGFFENSKNAAVEDCKIFFISDLENLLWDAAAGAISCLKKENVDVI